VILDATTRKIQILMDATATTTESPCIANWVDMTTTTTTPGSSNSISTGTAPVDAVAAPAASTQRVVQSLSVYNADTVNRIVTVRYNDNGTTRIVIKMTLIPGQVLYYTAHGGWEVPGAVAVANTVLTNANLTGPITSVGNATSIASQTGTGTTFVMSASPVLTGTPTAPTAAASTSTLQIATTAFVQQELVSAVTGLLDFKGNIDASANPNYPAASKGDLYYVNVAGKVGGASGKSVDIGDAVIANADNAGGTEASVGTSWFVLEHNLAGALLAANNLSDIANAATAVNNLGGAASTGTGGLVRIDSPVHTTQVTTPKVIGGTTTTSTLTLQPTSGVGTTGADIVFGVGNNGATEAMRILNSGLVKSALGIHVTGESTPASGAGTEFHWDGGNSTILSFDRTAVAFRPLYLSGSVLHLQTGGLEGLTIDASQNATFGGKVLLPNGASGAGNLALSFVGDTNTGLYRSAADEISVQTGGVTAVTVDASQRVLTASSIVCGSAAIATNATEGFLYVPSCAGTPSGTPTAFTGRIPIVYDSTNKILYLYDGSWRKATANVGTGAITWV